MLIYLLLVASAGSYPFLKELDTQNILKLSSYFRYTHFRALAPQRCARALFRDRLCLRAGVPRYICGRLRSYFLLMRAHRPNAQYITAHQHDVAVDIPFVGQVCTTVTTGISDTVLNK